MFLICLFMLVGVSLVAPGLFCLASDPSVDGPVARRGICLCMLGGMLVLLAPLLAMSIMA